jgi:hypothetical protein
MFLRWQEVAKKYALRGHHALVTKQSLMTDLQTTIYDSKDRITVPRYIFFDDKGNMLSKALEHPSSIAKLREQLLQLMKK